MMYNISSLSLSLVEYITLSYSPPDPTFGPGQRLHQTQEDARENRVREQHRRTS